MIISIQKKKQNRRWMYVIFGFVYHSILVPSVVMQTKTSCPIAAHAYHPTSIQGYKAGMVSWFVGVADELQGDDAAYSLAFANPGKSELSPVLTDTTLIVNNVPDQTNPLRGKSIALLSLLGINPLVVTADNLSELILLNIATEPHRLLKVSLGTAAGEPFAAVDIATLQNLMRGADSVVLSPNMTAAVALRPANGVFGDAGSGIGMIVTALIRNPNEEKKSNEGFKPEELMLGFAGVLPLDRQSHLIGINSPVLAMKNFVTLHSSELLQKIFVGINVATGTTTSDGAVAVLVAYMHRTPEAPVGALLEPVVTATALGEDAIIAARSCGEPVTVAAHHVRTMRTSTGLDYLIVNGGIGREDDTKGSVYALPLLRDTGTLAHAYAPPVTTYYGVTPIVRAFVTRPEKPQDLYTSNSAPALVGHGSLSARVTDMLVAGDAVFVATDEPVAGHAPGMWHSQAIFGAEGTIISWTPWRRAGGAKTAVPLKKIAFDEHAGTWWLIAHNAPYIRMTSWNTLSSLSACVKKTAGVQAPLYAMSESVRGIVPQLLIFTGYQKVVIAQIDEIQEGLLAPRNDFSIGHVSDNGTLSNFVAAQPCSWLSMTGGDLLRMGSLVTAVTIPRVEDSLIVAGGAGGVAALMTPQGSGMKTGENFSGVTPDLGWCIFPITVGGSPLKNVRKLCVDKGFLYILTLTQLLRVPISCLSNTQPNIEAVVLASIEAMGGSKYSTFADVFVAGPLVCLATSIGCFRTGAGVDVAAIHTIDEARWTKVNLPYSPGPIVHLASVGPVAHRHDNGYDANLYVLSAAATSVQARIYRLAISCTDVVTDSTVSLLPDEIVQGKRGFFLSLGDYRHSLVTDGAMLCLARNCYGKNHAYAEFLSPYWQIWPLSVTAATNVVRGAYRGVIAEPVSQVSTIMCSSGVGSWLMLTDIGLISNE